MVVTGSHDGDFRCVSVEETMKYAPLDVLAVVQRPNALMEQDPRMDLASQ